MGNYIFKWWIFQPVMLVFRGRGGVLIKKQKQATNPTCTERTPLEVRLASGWLFFSSRNSLPERSSGGSLPLKGTNQPTKRKLPQQQQKSPKIAKNRQQNSETTNDFSSFQGAAPMPIKGNMLIITKATNQPCSNQFFSLIKTTRKKNKKSGAWISGSLRRLPKFKQKNACLGFDTHRVSPWFSCSRLSKKSYCLLMDVLFPLNS